MSSGMCFEVRPSSSMNFTKSSRGLMKGVARYRDRSNPCTLSQMAVLTLPGPATQASLAHYVGVFRGSLMVSLQAAPPRQIGLMMGTAATSMALEDTHCTLTHGGCSTTARPCRLLKINILTSSLASSMLLASVLASIHRDDLYSANALPTGQRQP